ncbi:MAG: lysylphosphatidylglycerol synthase transmembrane domain-containing protein [Candidatus Aminicenantes bacterium]|jgi:uncharacterized protein (TIRG00374 family)
MKKKVLVLLLRLVISFGLIGYFLHLLANQHGGLGEALDKFISAFSSASASWLVPACLLHIVGFSLVSLRWKILLKAQGVNTAYKKLFSFYIMAAFFNTLLPSTIGGDTVRAIESKQLTGNTTTSVMVVIVERLTGLSALVLISAAALFIKIFRSTAQPQGVWIFLAVVLGGLFLLVVLVHPRVAPVILGLLKKILPAKIHSWLEQAYAAVNTYYKKPGALLGAFGISIIFQVNMVVYYFLLAKAFHQSAEPVDFMLKVPIMIFLLMTVPAINGLGIRTASFKGLMKIPAANALALEFIDLAFRIGYGLLGGLLFLFYRRSRAARQPGGLF